MVCMEKFEKLVAIEPVNLLPWAENELDRYAGEIRMYADRPADDDEIIRRIGDADAVLVSHSTPVTAAVMEGCPNIRYIGMCCSLYSPESANVDIWAAEARGITVKGIRDYGDEGVVEYVIHELVGCLHGFGQPAWSGKPREITGLKAGIVGLGKSGGMIADALHFLGAGISYFARSEKSEASAKGYVFMPLHRLLAENEVVFCCLNKNTVLLHDEEFEALGEGKILFNTGLSPAWDEKSFLKWLEGNNLCFCDTASALGCHAGNTALLSHPHVRCMNVSSGMTVQAVERLSLKVLDNIRSYLDGKEGNNFL